MEKLKLFTIYNKDQEPLKEAFVRTLKDDWDVNYVYIDMPSGDFLSPNFTKILKEKYTIARNVIRENLGKIILILDIDIQFFRPCEPEILKKMEDCDIAFQARKTHPDKWIPNGDVNTGFMAIRCNERTLQLFSKMLEVDWSKHENRSQATMEHLLKIKAIPNLKYGVMSASFWKFKLHTPYPPRDIILHHAIQVKEEIGHANKNKRIQLKMRQMNNVRKYVKGYSYRFWSPLRLWYQWPYCVYVFTLKEYKAGTLVWILQKIFRILNQCNFQVIPNSIKNYFGHYIKRSYS